MVETQGSTHRKAKEWVHGASSSSSHSNRPSSHTDKHTAAATRININISPQDHPWGQT